MARFSLDLSDAKYRPTLCAVYSKFFVLTNFPLAFGPAEPESGAVKQGGLSLYAKTGGYSLHELLVTVLVFAIVLTLGLPAFGDIVARHRVRVEIDALFHAIHLARKESIVRRRVVTLCPTVDFEVCVPTLDWSQGWMMFANHDRSDTQTREADEPLLRASSVNSGVRIMSK